MMMSSAGGTYLDRIVPAVRRRLDERKTALPLKTLLETPFPGRPPSFVEAIAAPDVSLIAEIKRASPSKGPIRPELDVASLIRAYERAGARAISVLTEEDFFRGSLADLREAVASTTLPVLRKDFIIDQYQVYEARAAGAAAVLLIAALLTDEDIEVMTGLAGELSMGVLLEVHDEAEALRALRFGDAVIGVNNRDLRTFEVTVGTTVEIGRLVPRHRLLVGESGIATHEDVRMLEAAGVDGVLVGESLLRNPDVEAAIEALMGAGLQGYRGADHTRKEETS
jgi:indole-3-glycerol phosphate synthase